MNDHRRLVDFLSEDIDDGIFGLGAQVALYEAGELLVNSALGVAGAGQPMTVQTLLPSWCASKPLLALCIHVLAERGELSLDEPISAQTAAGSCLSVIEATPRDLLNHAGGMVRPRALDAYLTPLHERLDLVLNGRTDEVGYSEYAAWRLLDELVTEIRRQTALKVVAELVVEPLGLGSSLQYDMPYADQLAPVLGRGAIFPFLPTRKLESWHDNALYMTSRDRLVSGAYTTAYTLARLYDRLNAVVNGRNVSGLPSPSALGDALTRGRGRVADITLNRTCDFAGGFMVDLAHHGMAASLPSSSFGHTGFTGAVFAITNPATSKSLAVIFNGVNAGTDDAQYMYRRYSQFCS